MPCDSGGYCGDSLRPELDKVTRLLCEVLGSLPSDRHLSLEVRAWWEQHQAEDRRKAEAEQQEQERRTKARAALDKLTSEERALLGIK
jgi:hypothetical protein